MRKIFIMAAVAATALLSACNNGAPKSNMKSETDTLSYALGLSYSAYIKGMMPQMQVDSAYMDEFLKGMREGLLAEDDKAKMARYMGIMSGIQLNAQLQNIDRNLFPDSTQELSRKNILAGLGAGLNDRSALKIDGKVIGPMESNSVADEHMQKLYKKAQTERYKKEKAESEQFMAKKAQEKGVQKLQNGVLYKVIATGTGEMPAPTDTVQVTYEGRLVDGTVFDSSERNDGKPTTFPISNVIPGWQIALTHMTVGSEWDVYIPYDQAYGEGGQPYGNIPPFAALIFKVKLVAIGK